MSGYSDSRDNRRERSRSRSRERQNHHHNSNHHSTHSSRDYSKQENDYRTDDYHNVTRGAEESRTVIIKAGSHGHPNAPQLIIDSRAVTLDYARDHDHHHRRRGEGGGPPPGNRSGRPDWMCTSCGCQNFARRDLCYKCSLPRPEHGVDVGSTSDPFSDSAIFSETPSTILSIKGLSPLALDESVTDLFRQLVQVKGVYIIRDVTTGYSRGVGFIELFSIEHAVYVIQNASSLILDRNCLRVGFTRAAFLQQHMNPQAPQTGVYPPSWPVAYPASYGYALQYPDTTSTVPITATTIPDVPTASLVRTKPSFPPCFESGGGAFVFQPQSACFYEPVTQFYFCPKSRLYYNSHEGTYFRHSPLVDPPFVPFYPPLPFDMETAALPSAVVVSAALETEASRKSIVISLGKTSAKAKMSTKIASDLSKWNERQRELLVETKDEVAMPVVYSVPIADTPLDVEPDVTVLSIPTFNPAEHKKELVAKPSGVIACLLCRRQFQSKDQLDRHERESKLHKENLAKAKPSEAMYRDRASERRAIHGSKDIPIVYDRPDESLVGASLLNSVSFILPPSPSPPHAPPAASNIPLGVSNAGNLLLRKMGWEEGAGLGRDGDGTRVPVGLDAARRDTAGLGTSSTTSSSTAPGGERGYRASIQSATRARFEQLSAAEKK